MAVSLLHPFAVLVCPSCYPSPRSRHEPCSPSRPVSRFSKQKYHIVRRVSATPRVLSQEIKRTYDAVKFSPLHDEYGTYVHHDYQYCRCTCRLHVIIVTRRVTRPNFAAAFAITLIKRVFFLMTKNVFPPRSSGDFRDVPRKLGGSVLMGITLLTVDPSYS